jgi:hypothetical protein
MKAPLGYRRNDPDETEGRLLYRQRAEAEVRMQTGLTRKVVLKTKEPRP